MMFPLKKILATFCFPVALLFLLLTAGMLMLWRKDRPSWNRWGRRMVTGAAVLYWVLGSNWCGDSALRPLVEAYPRLDLAALRSEKGSDWAPDYVVVLAAGHYRIPGMPPGLRLCERSLARVNLAFHLHREFPRSPVVCTGGTLYKDFTPISLDMAAVLRGWGVNGEMLITEEQARDTEEHVRFLRDLLEGKTFLLVTSSTHMVRAMALFRRAGLQPIAAPELDVELSSRQLKDVWRGLVPNAGNFGKFERAAYEYLGLLWAKLRGKI